MLGILEDTGRVPQALEAKPDLYGDCLDYVPAFFFLSSGRMNGMGIASISITDMCKYCEVYGIEDVEYFVTVIRAVDVTYKEQVQLKTKTAT